MTGDPHGRTPGKATLLVRAMDEIVGTHTIQRRAYELLGVSHRLGHP
jgi:hypothetical protein